MPHLFQQRIVLEISMKGDGVFKNEEMGEGREVVEKVKENWRDRIICLSQ